MKLILHRLVITAVLATFSFFSFAQDAQNIDPQSIGAKSIEELLANMPGRMDQFSLSCGFVALKTSKTVKLQQLSRAQNSSVASSDKLYEEGAGEVKIKFDAMNPTQKKISCQQAQAMQDIQPVSR